MTPLTLEEFAQELRRKGNWREAEFAVEILDLLDLEEEVAEPYENLRFEIEQYAKNFSNPDDAAKALGWIGDRSDVLAGIEKQLKDANREFEANAPDDVVQELLGILDEAEDILEAAGWPGDGDFIEGIQALADRPAPMEYDL